MKKSMISLAAILLLTGTIFSACNLSSTKVENARDDVQDAKKDLVAAEEDLYQARKDSILQFRKESEERISNYEKKIAELKTAIANEKKKDKAKYEIMLVDLENKNNELKRDLNDFKDEGTDDWKSFKTELSNDLDQLGKAVKDFTVDNN